MNSTRVQGHNAIAALIAFYTTALAEESAENTALRAQVEPLKVALANLSKVVSTVSIATLKAELLATDHYDDSECSDAYKRGVEDACARMVELLQKRAITPGQ